MSDEFGAVVEQELILPLKGLCELFAEEGAYAELAWFSNVLNMLGEPEDEAAVLRGVIELSKCAFLGFMYSYCLLYTSPSPRDQRGSRMPSSA